MAAMIAAAWGHDWMPPESRWCCDNKDCHPFPRDAVERTGDGWVIRSTGQIFRDGERGIYPNYAPDVGEVWICRLPTEPQARCLFVLPEGS
jgi:hypothetical protein